MTILSNLMAALIKQVTRSRDLATSDAARQLETAKRELRQAEKDILRARNRTIRGQAVLRYIGILQRHLTTFGQELNLIKEELEEITDAYADAYEAWEQEAPRFQKPRRIEANASKAATFKLVGLAAALSEYMLAVYQTSRGAEYGIATALFVSAFTTTLMVLLAHGVMAAADKHSPTEVRDFLLAVLWPASGVTVIPLAVFFLFRSLSGDYLPDFLLTLLQPVNDVALWLSTLGLIPVGAAFLGLSALYGWSGRLTQRYEQLRRLKAELEGYRNELLAQAYKQAGYQVLPDEPPQSTWTRLNAPLRRVGMLLVLCLPAALSGCGGAASDGQRAAVQELTAPSQPVELHLFIDVSQSLETAAAERAAGGLQAQLGDLVKATGATRISVTRFADNGWSIPPSVVLDLPRYVPPPPVVAKRSKLPRHLEEARARRNAALWAETEQRAKEAHAEALNQALGAFDLALLLPPKPARDDPPCTDLLGVLLRMAQRPRGSRHYYIILTDGYHTCGGRQMKPVGAPQGELRALVLLVPADAKESRGQRADSQYAERSAALLKAVPWLVIVPADEGDLVSHLTGKPAAEKMARLLP